MKSRLFSVSNSCMRRMAAVQCASQFRQLASSVAPLSSVRNKGWLRKSHEVSKLSQSARAMATADSATVSKPARSLGNGVRATSPLLKDKVWQRNERKCAVVEEHKAAVNRPWSASLSGNAD